MGRSELQDELWQYLFSDGRRPDTYYFNVILAVLIEDWMLKEYLTCLMSNEIQTSDMDGLLRLALEISHSSPSTMLPLIRKEDRLAGVFEKLLKDFGESAVQRITDNIICLLQSFDRNSGMMQSPEDYIYTNVWEEYCSQVQGQVSIFWAAYVDTIRSLIQDALNGEPENVQKAIWLLSEAYSEWYWDCPGSNQDSDFEAWFEKDRFPNVAEYADEGDAVDVIYSAVWEAAANYKLPEEDDQDEDEDDDEDDEDR